MLFLGLGMSPLTYSGSCWKCDEGALECDNSELKSIKLLPPDSKKKWNHLLSKCPYKYYVFSYIPLCNLDFCTGENSGGVFPGKSL